jgi:1-acyl-sn-glycerol-3-phosphate acyltransferase
MSNHISTWDAVLIFCVFWRKTLCFMTASILFTYNKLFSWFIRSLGAVRVDRQTTDLTAFDDAIRELERGRSLVIFPEGYRSLQGDILPFRPGVVIIALLTRTPVIPVYIAGRYSLFHRMRMAIGEPIDICRDFPGGYPSQEKIRELTDMLRDKVIALSGTV